MKRSLKRVLAAGLGAALCLSTVPVTALAQEAAAGTPYAADGTYNVSVPHVVVNQVFGASDDAKAVTHSFIELYNQSDAEVSLEGWYAYYKSSPDGGDTAWSSLALQGTIAAKGHFLIRCGQVDTVADGAWQIPAGDMEWNVQLHNKGVSVALFSQNAELTDAFAGAVTDANRPAGYVDVLAVQGNDAEAAQIPPVYEGEYENIQSKKKAVRRENFADTDDNAADAGEADYSELTAEDKPVVNGKGETVAAQQPSAPAYEVKNDSFEQDARLTMQKAGGITLGEANGDGGVAEIVSFNADTNRAYVVNGQESVLNIFDVKADGSFGEAEKLNIQELMKAKDPAFAYGDMTSVAVDTETDRVAVALQDADYTKPGRIAVLNYENEIVSVYTAGVQPDMVAFAAGGRYILTADEGEPREGYGAGTSDPAGTVTVADTQTGKVRQASFAAFGAEELAASGVLFNRVNGEILSAEFDLEPEYIAVSGGTAYVALQEANAVALLDIASAQFTKVLPLGFKDYSKEENAVDLNDEDGTYLPKTYNNTYGVYMPDGIAVYEAEGKTYILTANEGDAREWGDFCDEIKREGIAATDGTVLPNKVRVLDNTCKAGIPAEGNYLYGGRSFSIFEVAEEGLSIVYDSAGEFEAKTFQYLPAYYNVSNDDVELESRTAKKGIEPEAVTLAAVNGRTYAFIALERIGGIMAYDITDPAEAAFVNYINTRDFNDALTGDVAPEGLAVLAREESVYLLAAFEVSGTVASYRLTDAEAPAVSAVAVTGFDLDYTVGEEFAGGTLLVIYADGSTKEVALTADMLEGFDTSSVGEKQVTITYAGKTAQIAVTVEAAPQPEPVPEPTPEPVTVSAVAVTGFDLDYTVGDAFAGGTLLVIYSDGSTKEVALTADMLEGFDTSSIGEKQVTVTYEGKTAQIAVTVEAAPQPEPTPEPEPEPEPTPEPEPVPEPSEEDGAAGAWAAFGIAAAVAVAGWVVAVVFILRRK